MSGLLVALGYAFACLVAGLLALRLIAGSVRGPALGASAFIVGQALLSSVWTAVALAGAFQPAVILGVLLLCIFIGAVLVRALPRPRLVRPTPLAIALAVLIAAFGVAAAVTPPVGDAEAFYLVYARVIAASGRLEPMPGLYEGFSTIGLVGELHMAALVALSGVPAAKFLAWLVGLSAAAMLDSIAIRAGCGRVGRLVTLGLAFTSTAFTYHLFDGKVDLWATALALAAMRWALSFSEESLRRATVVVAGLCTGYCVVAKFSFALGVVPAIATLVLWQAFVSNSRLPARQTLQSMALFSACAFAAVVPHLVKNGVLFGAPLAPFVGRAADDEWLQQVWFSPALTRQIVLTYPLALVYGRYPMQGGNLSFLLLAFLPLLAWLPRQKEWRESTLVQLSVAALVGTALWVALRPSIIAPRYILASLLVFYPVVARGAEHAIGLSAPLLRAGIVSMLFAAVVIFSAPVVPALKSLWAGGSRCALASSYCAPVSQLSERAAPGDRVFYAGYYAYWLRDDLLQCRDQGAESRLSRQMRGPGLSWESLEQGGFRWLVIERQAFGKEWEALSRTPPSHLRIIPVWDDRHVIIVQLERERGGAAPRCIQTGRTAWRVERPS